MSVGWNEEFDVSFRFASSANQKGANGEQRVHTIAEAEATRSIARSDLKR
jgi:hypothetical protein